MKKILLLLGLALMANGALGSAAIKAKFAVSVNIGTSVFISVPHNQTLAEAEGWEQCDRPDGSYRSSLIMYCDPQCPMLSVMYDDLGHPGGVQIAVLQDSFTNSVYDWETQGYTSWTANINGTSKDFWAIPVYFMSEEYLALSSTERASNYTTDTLLQEGSVWVTGFNNELVAMGDDTSGVEAAGFTKQSCIVWMGRHYYWNMTADTECSAETILPFFMLLRSGKIIGFGWNCPGEYESYSTCKITTEKPSKSAVEVIVPDGPTCMAEQADSPGMVTLHVYFIDDPQLTLCLSS